MKKLNLMALLVGAALFTGIGATTLSASDMKCGAGKCGNAKEAPAKAMKCGDGKCGESKKTTAKSCCNSCSDKTAPQKAMKCGAGKCGSK